MPASINDKFTDVRNSARPNTATVSTLRVPSASNLACDSLIGWPTASKVHFVTYQTDTNNNVIAGTQLDCVGIVSANTITNLVVIDGTDGGNSVGDVVEMLPTAAWAQDLADGLMVTHDRDGSLKDDVVTTAKIAPLNVTSAELAADSVTTTKILAANVTDAKLAVATQTKLTAISATADSSWTEPALSNSWVTYDAASFPTLAYRMDGYGYVHFKGLIKNGTLNATVFTLPVGYRPSKQLHIATVAGGAFANIAILPSGVVHCQVGSTGWYSFDGLSFKAEQ